MAVGAEKHLHISSFCQVLGNNGKIVGIVLPCWVGVSETTTRYLVDFHWSLGKWFIFQESIQVILAYILSNNGDLGDFHFHQLLPWLLNSCDQWVFNHGCLGFIGDYVYTNQLYVVIIISYMVFIISHCKNPYKPISTMIATCFFVPDAQCDITLEVMFSPTWRVSVFKERRAAKQRPFHGNLGFKWRLFGRKNPLEFSERRKSGTKKRKQFSFGGSDHPK